MRALYALAALILALTACGETKIELTADKLKISAGGIESAMITARLLRAGDPEPNGRISFTTTGGSFDSTAQVDSTEVTTGSDGTATLNLFSGPNPGNGTITAEYFDDASGISATGSISIEFTPATGNKRPVDGTFRLSCDSINIGASRTPVPDIKVVCSLTGRTRDGQTIPASAFNPEFLVEAGNLTKETDDFTGEVIIVYDPKQGPSSPKDVAPETSLNEPSHFDMGGGERNPRDGLVTLAVVVEGEEAFTDSNGNGKFDDGELFDDSFEPWLDKNDNDQKDDDEPFIDTNENGVWDAGNGEWDANTKIMAIFKILWTGPLDHGQSKIESSFGSGMIPDGGQLELQAKCLDRNANPIAAYADNDDHLEWVLNSSGDAISNDNDVPPLQQSYGFEFDTAANTERGRWKIVPNTFAPKVFKYTIQDGDPGDTNMTPTAWTVTATARSTPGRLDGFFATQKSEPFAEDFDGTCN